MSKVEVVTKAEVVDEVAKVVGCPKAQAVKVLDTFFNVVSKNVKKGKKVALTGYISFSVAERKARVGINPQTKQKVKYPAKKYVKAKLGNKLKNLK